MSSDSRSRMALAYSARLNRCGRVRPGRGRVAAALSSVFSRPPTNASRVAAAGRGLPAGGIMLPRTFLMTFSQTSASRCRFEASRESSASPPVLSRWLWQVTQYWPTRAPEPEAPACWAAGTAGAWAWGADEPVHEPAAQIEAATSAARVIERWIRVCIRGRTTAVPGESTSPSEGNPDRVVIDH